MNPLRGIPLFAELSDDDLARIATRLITVPAGTVIIREGTPPDALYVVESGEVSITKQTLVLNTCGPGELIGELSVLEGRPRTATVTARTEARLIVVDVSAIHELLRASPTATLAILRTMATRLTNTEAVLRQHDTLAGLGRIAAGLAHELNNPASAVKRGAVELETKLREPPFDHHAGALPARSETAMQRARREQALEAELERRGIANAWELAPALAALNWETIDASLTTEALRTIIALASMRAIARDISESATRISELVGAVRANSHLGEAPSQTVDIHAGLDSTLALFRHQLGTITVHRDYGELPTISAHGSELNQVWTNLIDNAIHAMGGSGTLQLATRVEDEQIVVEIIDSGPGIPADLQAEIWKPFFTTKGVGEGTGLGLHLARNVIVQRHRGAIELDSRPGRTCFRVRLPL